MVVYSRVTPFGFIDPKTSTDEDNFYGEEVTLSNEVEVLAAAEYLRGLLASSGSIQTNGFGTQSQADDMAEVLRNVKIA